MTSRNTALADILVGDQTVATPDTLESLWATAEGYGYVRVYSSSSQPKETSYCVTIEFATIGGTTLEAQSEYGSTLKAALRQAIDRAEQIRGQFK